MPKQPKRPGFMVRKPGVNPFALYHTCAFNLEWVTKNGYNQCICCIMGTMDPRKPIKSMMMYAFKEKLCRLMQHGLKKPIAMSPLPLKCWNNSTIAAAAKEQLALKNFEAAQAKSAAAQAKSMGPVPKSSKKDDKRLKQLEKQLEKKAKEPKSPPSSAEKAAEKAEAKRKEDEAEAVRQKQVPFHPIHILKCVCVCVCVYVYVCVCERRERKREREREREKEEEKRWSR